MENNQLRLPAVSPVIRLMTAVLDNVTTSAKLLAALAARIELLEDKIDKRFNEHRLNEVTLNVEDAAQSIVDAVNVSLALGGNVEPAGGTKNTRRNKRRKRGEKAANAPTIDKEMLEIYLSSLGEADNEDEDTINTLKATIYEEFGIA